MRRSPGGDSTLDRRRRAVAQRSNSVHLARWTRCSALLPLLWAAPVVAQTECPPRLNHAPSIVLASPHAQREYRVGGEIQIPLVAQDLDADPLTFRAEQMPEGAQVGANDGIFVFTPRQDQLGRHAIRVTVSDGHASALVAFEINVVANAAPRKHYRGPLVRFVADSSDLPDGFSIASDPDSDWVSVRKLRGPPGLTLTARGSSVSAVWYPTKADLGEHELSYEISDGVSTTRVDTRVVVLPAYERERWSRALIPGIGFAGGVSTAGKASLGGAFDVTVYAERRGGERAVLCMQGYASEECQPSHRRVYLELEVLRADEGDYEFNYGLGYSSTLELLPQRRWLLPVYGVEFGLSVSNDAVPRAAARPYTGAHLWASDGIWLTATAGYRLIPSDLLDRGGMTYGLKASVVAW